MLRSVKSKVSAPARISSLSKNKIAVIATDQQIKLFDLGI